MRDRCDYAHAAETLTADMPRVTPAGVTFLAPSGWSMATECGVVILLPPDADSQISARVGRRPIL